MYPGGPVRHPYAGDDNFIPPVRDYEFGHSTVPCYERHLPWSRFVFQRIPPPLPTEEMIGNFCLVSCWLVTCLVRNRPWILLTAACLPMVAVLPGHGNSSRPYFQKTWPLRNISPPNFCMNTVCFLVRYFTDTVNCTFLGEFWTLILLWTGAALYAPHGSMPIHRAQKTLKFQCLTPSHFPS